MSSLSEPLPLNGGLADVFARFPAGSVVEDLPLVIDNGSFQCRAGFAVSGHASELTPERAASFRPLIHTRRGHKNAAVAGFPAASGQPQGGSLASATADVSAIDLWSANGLRLDQILTNAQQRSVLFGGFSSGNRGSGSGLGLGHGSQNRGGSGSASRAGSNLSSGNFGLYSGPHVLFSPFENGVVTNFDAQERVFDHVFSSLGINGDEHVPHALVLTESACNPSLSRKYMLELCFEAYGVPAVCLGADSLFSTYFEDAMRAPEEDSLLEHSLIVSAGSATTELIPIVEGRAAFSEARRFDVGGDHCVGFMQRLAHTTRPDLRNDLSLDKIEEMTHTHCYVAPQGYATEVDRFFPHLTRRSGAATVATKLTFGSESQHSNGTDQLTLDQSRVRALQLPFTPAPVVVQTDEEKAAEERQRKERSERLKLMLEQRRLQKQVVAEDKLAQFEHLLSLRPETVDRDLLDVADIAEYRDAISELGLWKTNDVNDDRFLGEYFKLKKQVLRGRRTAEGDTACGLVEAEEARWSARVERERFALVGLPPSDPKLKTKKMQALQKKQIALKAMYDGQQRARAASEEEKRKREQMEALEEEEFRKDPDKMLFDLRTRRAKLLSERAQRERSQKRRVGKSRHTVASLERMRLLARLAVGNEAGANGNDAAPPRKRRKKSKNVAEDISDEDEFGMDDSDWNAYLRVQKEKGAVLTDTGEVDLSLLSPEERQEQEALADVCRLLERFDPDFKENIDAVTAEDAAREAHALLAADDEAARSAILAEQKRLIEDRSRLTALSFGRPIRSFRGLRKEDFQMNLGVERIRVPEVLFEPSVVGINQMGLSECLSLVLGGLRSHLSESAISRIAGNVLVTGGSSQFSGFDERVSFEARQVVPIEVPVRVRRAQEPMWGAFYGACLWSARAAESGNFGTAALTRNSWEECGPDYLKDHFFSSNIGHSNFP